MKNILILASIFISIISKAQGEGPWNMYNGNNYLTENTMTCSPHINSYNLSSLNQQWLIQGSMILWADTTTIGKMYIAYNSNNSLDTNQALTLISD